MYREFNKVLRVCKVKVGSKVGRSGYNRKHHQMNVKEISTTLEN